jgi:tetratricopeptide (TPR) repeat protein
MGTPRIALVQKAPSRPGALDTKHEDPTMPRLQSEYILKGVYLGLLLYVAISEPPWQTIGLVALCTLGGVAVALLVTAIIKLRQGFQVRGRFFPFLLFLLLESPTLTYLGVLGGTFLGTQLIDPNPQLGDDWLLLKLVGAGAVLGLILGQLREIADRRTRLGFCLLLAVFLVFLAIHLFGYHGKLPFTDTMTVNGLIPPEHKGRFGLQILLGIPIFYLLTFAGRAEETEVESAVLSAALALGLMMLFQAGRIEAGLQSLAFVVPLFAYFLYTWRVLPRLRVFKHVVRGFSYAEVGRYGPSLLAFRKALEFDPKNKLAQEGTWEVHQKLDVDKLGLDPQLLALVDFDRCIERISTLLLGGRPTPARLGEAQRLMGMVLSQRPQLRPKVGYWRAVALTHAGDLDGAAAELEAILSGKDYAPGDPQRQAILLQAWQLALMLHDDLARRVGQPMLAQPGLRMEAIGAVERYLSEYPEDQDIWNLKRLLYSGLSEEDYLAAAGDRPAAQQFDHPYAQQLGISLINDPQRWQRGVEYLRMAARGLVAMGPSIFIQIAQAHDRAGNPDAAWLNYELAKRAGSLAGPRNLTDADRQAYFAVVKMLGEEAMRQGNTDQAIEDFRLYSEYERAGLETMRTLAGLYESKEDALSALHYTELGLVYNAADRDLLERRDRYYYSIQPEDLQRRMETYGGGFNVEYCLTKAKTLLDYREADMDVIDWAHHLIRLAVAAKPAGIRARVILARALLRRGERDEAVTILEELRASKPEKFASDDDEEAWFQCCQLLGKLYLDELGKPDLAIQCFQAFRQSPRSGADTMYRMGQAYEQLGDPAKAIKCYEHVTAYEQHPLVSEARSAIYRLQHG